MARDETTVLGSASIGTPSNGKLRGAVQLLPSDGIQPAGDQPWGTDVAVRSIERAVREVRRCFPGTPKLFVGDLSRKEGGFLQPHKSHQSGLDADVGYYYLANAAWFQPTTGDNLDKPRSYAFVRAFVEGGTVAAIYMDRSIIRLLKDYATAIDEKQELLRVLFGTDEDKKDGIVQHLDGHTTHFHVRFADPASVGLGAKIAKLVESQPAKTPKPPKTAAPVKKKTPMKRPVRQR